MPADQVALGTTEIKLSEINEGQVFIHTNFSLYLNIAFEVARPLLLFRISFLRFILLLLKAAENTDLISYRPANVIITV